MSDQQRHEPERPLAVWMAIFAVFAVGLGSAVSYVAATSLDAPVVVGIFFAVILLLGATVSWMSVQLWRGQKIRPRDTRRPPQEDRGPMTDEEAHTYAGMMAMLIGIQPLHERLPTPLDAATLTEEDLEQTTDGIALTYHHEIGAIASQQINERADAASAIGDVAALRAATDHLRENTAYMEWLAATYSASIEKHRRD